MEHSLRVVEAAPRLADRVAWCDAAGDSGYDWGCLCRLQWIDGDWHAERDLVPSLQHSLFSNRGLVYRSDGAVLPCLEVCGRIPQPDTGSCVRLGSGAA